MLLALHILQPTLHATHHAHAYATHGDLALCRRATHTMCIPHPTSHTAHLTSCICPHTSYPHIMHMPTHIPPHIMHMPTPPMCTSHHAGLHSTSNANTQSSECSPQGGASASGQAAIPTTRSTTSTTTSTATTAGHESGNSTGPWQPPSPLVALVLRMDQVKGISMW